MIMTVTELRQFITTDASDATLTAELGALEPLVRAYTHNNFQKRNFRAVADIVDGGLVLTSPLFQTGDTVEISGSQYNDGVYVYPPSSLIDEDGVTVTKVAYPADVKMGVANMVNWDLQNREKLGIQSESISRHSVTYASSNGDGSSAGYPKSLIGFLEPYRKARF